LITQNFVEGVTGTLILVFGYGLAKLPSAEYVTALATAVLAIMAIAAFLLARRQLLDLNKNEVIKATIDYINRYTSVPVEIDRNQPVTAFKATGIATGINQSLGTRARFIQLATAYQRDMKSLTEDDLNTFALVRGCAASAGTFFVIATSLIRRSRLDAGLFIEMYRGQFLDYWAAVNSVADADPIVRRIAADPELKHLAAMCEAWNASHPMPFNVR
jgi:hypothetical protein